MKNKQPDYENAYDKPPFKQNRSIEIYFYRTKKNHKNSSSKMSIKHSFTVNLNEVIIQMLQNCNLYIEEKVMRQFN